MGKAWERGYLSICSQTVEPEHNSTSHAKGWEVKFPDGLGSTLYVVFIFGGERQILMMYVMREHVCSQFQTHFHFELGDSVYYPTGTAFLSKTKIKIVVDMRLLKIISKTVRCFEKSFYLWW